MWKIETILRELREAGLPEPTDDTVIAGWFLPDKTVFLNQYKYQQYKVRFHPNPKELAFEHNEFDSLPSAIQKLQELLTDKTGGGNE